MAMAAQTVEDIGWGPKLSPSKYTYLRT